MKFQANNRRKAAEYEKDLARSWKEHKIFEKSVKQRPIDNSYVFYDGPPFITGVPHHGTLLSSVVKDAIPRYQTMLGKRVERVWGWDCHGLPAEVFTEKKLGIRDKRDIGTKISLEDYITTCRANMVQTGDLWETTIDRIGRWVDFKGAYKTMDKEYMESVWWAFKQLYDKGKIYEGEKVLLYCTRDATPISKAEVAMDNSYQDVTDPSVFVKFRLKDWSGTNSESSAQDSAKQLTPETYLLAWTTTPWTLPANTAVAINKNVDYVELEQAGQRFIIAKDLAAKVMVDDKHQPLQYTVKRTFKGKELVGKSYEPLFADRGKNAHKVWHADYVSIEDGTGIVHLAPAYGEEDYQLAREMNFPFISTIDDNGFYTEGPWKGEYVWDANKPIAKQLHEQGVVWKIDYIRHSYPHCHRCGTKLMYRAHPSWFMDIDGQRTEMLEENGDVNWFPGHIKNGRFEKTVQTAPDWNLSRDRFWATAMPVWKGIDNNGLEKIKVVGSYAELAELSGVTLDDYHRPWVDDVTFTIDGVEYKRIDKVLDCWFESGSMPFAQFHYPFENVQKFEANFPGDFIAEYVGQVRAWFYYLHAVNVGLFGKKAFKNVIVTGTVAGNDGRKMSKSFGNYTDPNELMDQYSADALRFLLLGSPLLSGEDFSLQDKDVADIQRKLAMVWNMYDFFTMYAAVDGWEYDPDKPKLTLESLNNPLDRWIVSRVHQLTTEVAHHMDNYDVASAVKPILPFVDDASNWYVRRSRRRFWKSGNSQDKNDAYRTLHYVLVRLSHVMAPFTPFLADELYQRLTGGESVHLQDWPVTDDVDELLARDMAQLRDLITQGLAQRAKAGVKVRQPLQTVSLTPPNEFLVENRQFYHDIVQEELNVKTVVFDTDTESKIVLDTENISPELRREGLMREVVRNVQTARKKAGLNIDDHISLTLSTDDKQLAKAIDEHRRIIEDETLGKLTTASQEHGYADTVRVEGQSLTIGLSKA